MKRLLKKKFFRDDRANASLEFVLVFPVIILMACTAFEAGVLAIRQVMLDTAMQDVLRELRISSENLPTQTAVNDLVCERAMLIPDCSTAISVEVAPVDTVGWDVNRAAMECNDRDNDFVPIQEYVAGESNELMMVRICAVFEPLYPRVGLGAELKRVNESDYAIVTASIYVNEPT